MLHQGSVAMVQVRVKSTEALLQEITVTGAKIVADATVADGGAGSGPSPYELLLSSLGACMAMTLRLYAGRSKWPLEGIELSLSHEKASTLGKDAAEDTKDRVTSRLTLRGPLTEEQRQRLFVISGRCPVHRLLAPVISFDEHLEPPDA
jgi:putative redox protein